MSCKWAAPAESMAGLPAARSPHSRFRRVHVVTWKWVKPVSYAWTRIWCATGLSHLCGCDQQENRHEMSFTVILNIKEVHEQQTRGDFLPRTGLFIKHQLLLHYISFLRPSQCVCGFCVGCYLVLWSAMLGILQRALVRFVVIAAPVPFKLQQRRGR